jgi:hypothetical protein
VWRATGSEIIDWYSKHSPADSRLLRFFIAI